jgi:hypothetical protein
LALLILDEFRISQAFPIRKGCGTDVDVGIEDHFAAFRMVSTARLPTDTSQMRDDQAAKERSWFSTLVRLG